MTTIVRSYALLMGLLATGIAVPPTGVAQEPHMRRDIVYAHRDGMALVYDVEIPESPNGAGVVFVISGGFLSSLEQQELIAPVADPLRAAGFTIFNLRHPSTPRYLAPEIYEAVGEGLQHILTHAGEFGVDPARIGTLGMSTGGLLSLLITLDHPADTSARHGERPAAAVAFMPMTDMRPYVGNVRATPSLGFDPALAPSLSPIDFVSVDDPPVLLIHGSRDQIVDPEANSRRLLDSLTAAGVPSDLVMVDAGHELFAGQAKVQADRAMVEWFSNHLLE